MLKKYVERLMKRHIRQILGIGQEYFFTWKNK